MIIKKRKLSIKMSYFVKLVITYSILLTCSVSVLFYVQYSYFIPIISESDIKYELEAFNKLTKYTKDSYKKILSDTIVGMYSQTEMIETIKMVNKNTDLYYEQDISQKINNYLNAVTSANSDILDFIIITDSNMSYQSSSKSGRAIKTRYDFSSDVFLNEIKNSKTKLDVISDDPSRYIINESQRTITFIGNIYDPNNPSSLKSIGNFIINVALDTFRKSFKEFEENLNGKLFILDSKGRVIFTSDPDLKFIGEEYQYYNKIKGITNQKILLDKPNIVRTYSIDNDKITVVNTLPEDFVWKKLSGLRKEMIMMLVISLVVGIIITFAISYFFNIRIKTLIKYMKKVQNGDLEVKIPIRSSDEIGQLSIIFNEMCHKLNNFINREYFAEISRKNSELDVLQSQINPHFLYNTLESIKMKAVIEGQDEISNMITILGSIFRWNVKTKDKIVRLEDEIEYITSYLELIKYRFDGKLDVEINISEDILNLGIPKLIMQPIVENSVVHGISNIEGIGRIVIDVSRNEDLLDISIFDNGIGMDENSLQELSSDLNERNNREYYKIGIKNVHDRIRLIFGIDFGLNISSRIGEGTTVKMRIPALLKEDMKKFT